MNDQTLPQTVLFPDLFDTPLVATFDQQQASSDGGAVLLKAAERQYEVIEGFAQCLVDSRQPGKVRHTLEDLLGQRIFGIAVWASRCQRCRPPGRRPHPTSCCSGATRSRVMRSPPNRRSRGLRTTWGAPRSIGWRAELAMSVVARHRRRRRGRARRITIDLDPTDDATHGAQQLTFFNGYYDRWCYLPLLAFLTFDDEAEQYLAAAVLRPGNVPATQGAVGVLRRLLALLRLAFPQARFLVRLDGGFATPEIFDVLDAEPRLDYVVAMAKNAVLVRHAEPAMAAARVQSEERGETEHVYTDVVYAARTWGRERRVVIKAEVVRLTGRAPQDNSRFVVTNLRQTPRFIYERIYCARGDIENRIKELHDGLQIRPHELLSLLGESAAGAPHRGGLRVDARTPAPRRADRVCPHPGDLAARPAAQVGGPRRRLGPSHRPPPADGDAGLARLATHRTRAWCPSGLTNAPAPPAPIPCARQGGAVVETCRAGSVPPRLSLRLAVPRLQSCVYATTITLCDQHRPLRE